MAKPKPKPTTTFRVGDISSNEFINSFGRLLSIRNIPAFVRLRLVDMAIALQAEQVTIQDKRLDELRKYVKCDKKRNPKVQEDGVNFVWKSDKDKDTFSKTWNAYLDTEVTVEMSLLKMENLNKVDLSPAELILLRPIFEK